MVRVREEQRVLALYLLTDLLVFYSAISVATLSRFGTLYQIDFVELQRDRLVCLLFFVVAAMMAGIYRPATVCDRFDSIYFTMLAAFGSGVAALVLAGLIPADIREISRRELVLGFGLAGMSLTLWHFAAARLMARFRAFGRHFYLVGDEPEGRRIAAEITSNPSLAAEAEYVTLEQLQKIIEEHHRLRGQHAPPTEDVIITPTVEDRRQVERILEFCAQNCRRIFLYPTIHDTLMFHHNNLLAISGIPLIQLGGHHPATPYTYLKRSFDILVSGVALLAALPIFVITAVAVSLSSPGGVFYTQKRQGRHGWPFHIIKFRSMRPVDEAGADYVRASKNDSRVTPVGAFIRKYKIDELPQLINVLRGDMSLIGPRPLWEGFCEQHGEECPLWDRRLAVRPGVTGLAHVLGSSFSKPSDFLRYDLVYISSLSFLVDLKVLAATVRIVLGGKGGQ